jgi:hypothetical protein
MSGFADALAIVAVVILVIVRQFRASRIDTAGRWWLMPVILAAVALRKPGILDAHHDIASAVLLVAEVLIGLVTGAGWAWTTRLWVEADGALWSKSTKASVAVWIVGICLRAGLFALGAALGVHQDTSALLLALAVTLLVRSGILAWRGQSLRGTPLPGAAYGDGMSRPAWKERV